jgi:hypothetical protein
MSKSVRLSDELVEQAKQEGDLFHRSPPQQIEHWAEVGRVMESVLSYPAQARVMQTALRKDLDAALSVVETAEGKRRAKAVIARTSGRYSRGK